MLGSSHYVLANFGDRGPLAVVLTSMWDLHELTCLLQISK